MNNQPTSVAEMWPSKYLKADDMQGKTYELVIERVAFEMMRSSFTNQDEKKCVVYFQNAHKGLVLNKTQALAITEIAGSDVFADWVGKRVRLSPGRAKNGKGTVVVGAPAKKDMV
jgi:hypothetical protein